MLKVTSRYLSSNFIPPFLIGFVFFVAFLITFYMFRIISLIVNKGVEIGIVMGLVSDLSVSFFPLATPLAVFFATIYTLNRLSEDSEIIAMRSFGMPKYKIYLPFFIISTAIGLTIFALNSTYIPAANANFRNTILKLTSNGMLTSIKAGQFFTDIPSATLFAEGVSDDGDNFAEVFLHLKDKNGAGERVIFAKSGSLIKLYADEWNAPSLRLHLKDGNIVKMLESGSKVEKILFEEYDFPVLTTDLTSNVLDKDSMKSNSELTKTIAIKNQNYKEILKSNKDSALKKEARKSLVKSKIEYFTRYITVAQIILFNLLAFTLGIKKGRGGGGHNSITAIGVLIGYYALYFFLISLAQRTSLDPFIACSIPVVLLLVISGRFYRKLDWVG